MRVSECGSVRAEATRFVFILYKQAMLDRVATRLFSWRRSSPGPAAVVAISGVIDSSHPEHPVVLCARPRPKVVEFGRFDNRFFHSLDR